MSSSKAPKVKKKKVQNAEKLALESRHVEHKSKHEVMKDDEGGRVSLKTSLNSKERHLHFGPRKKQKNFRIPKKNEQGKELLQTQPLDSREVAELLRQVSQSFRFQNSASMFKFEKVEIVNNDDLRQKHADKKLEMRPDFQKNREIETKFGFLYTTSRTKVKNICENGLQTGHTDLTFLGDPNLGVYLNRYPDVVYKRPLDDKDQGYLIVFTFVKGRVKGISGGNPEQQPTPNHDCHMSKLFMNLPITASHLEVYKASMLYFYEIDETSDNFYSKQPRQVLPYAVLSFSIVKPDVPQPRPLKPISEVEYPASRSDNTKQNDTVVFSPVTEEMEDIFTTTSTISWSGQLLLKGKFVAFINLVSYSTKKLFLPEYVEQKINICKKIPLEHLKTLFKYPIFRNGKPSSSGVSREFGIGGKFIYYEIEPVHNERQRFDKLLAHLVQENIAGVIEYIGGAVHMYIIPTSQLTHYTGITDKKSPVCLHALVHVRRIRPYPVSEGIPETKENKTPNESSNTAEKEESIYKRLQVIMREKLNIKPKPPSLLALKVKPAKHLDKDRLNKSTKSASRENSDSRRSDEHSSTKSKERSSTKSKLHRSDSRSGHDDFGHRAHSSTYTRRDDRCKRDKRSSLGNFDKTSSSSEKSSRSEGRDKRDDTHAEVSKLEDAGQTGVEKQSNQDSSRLSNNEELPLSITEVQELIKAYKKLNNQITTEASLEKACPPEDPRLEPRKPSSDDVAVISEKTNDSSAGTSKKLSIATPPIPPPLPSTLSPLVTPVNKTVSSSAPSTPGSSSVQSASFSQVLLKTLSSLGSGSKVFKGKEKDVTSSTTFLSGWPSPPSVERKNMEIPGLEPPGSPFWQEKRYLSVKNDSKDSPSGESTSNVKEGSSYSCPVSPLVQNRVYINQSSLSLANNNQAVAPSPIVNLQPVPLAAKNDTTSLHSDSSYISPQNLTTKSRPITKAEQTSALALEKVRSILKQNANLQKSTAPVENVSPVKVNIVSSTTTARAVKSILKKPFEDVVKSPSDQCTNTQEKAPEEKSTSEITDHVKEVQKEANDCPVKVVSLSEYRLKRQNSVGGTESSNDLSASNCSSQAEELKNITSTILDVNAQSTSLSSISTKPPINTTDGEPKDENKADTRLVKSALPKKRKRIVTIKSKETNITGGYDDISDISDADLPEDDITSDISDIEQPDDFKGSDDEKLTLKANSRSSSCETTPSKRHRSHRRDEHESRFHERQFRSDKSTRPSTSDNRRSHSPLSRASRTPPHTHSRRSHSPLSRASRTPPHTHSRRSHSPLSRASPSISPDNWDSERKRRRTAREETDTRDSLVYDNANNCSGSEMSISPINSPVSFEYTTDGVYHSVKASPLIGGMSTPRSPIEVARLDSPGTPETAVPAADFVHANIGYWSKSNITNREDAAAMPYGAMGYLETQVDSSIYETANLGNSRITQLYNPMDLCDRARYDDIAHYETSNLGDIIQSGYFNTNSEPYPAQQSDGAYLQEEPRMDSREFSLRRRASTGSSSGCDSPSYMELNRPFFGNADDVGLYGTNTSAVDNYSENYMDAYPLQPIRVDDINEDLYSLSRSPFGDVPSSPRSMASLENYDNDDDRYEGRCASTTPDPFQDLMCSIDRRVENKDDYGEYVNKLPIDNQDNYSNYMDVYELELYHNERGYNSDEEVRERNYNRYNEDDHSEAPMYYSSDDEEPIRDSLMSSSIDTHNPHSSSTHDTFASTCHSTHDSQNFTRLDTYDSDYSTEEETVNYADTNNRDYNYLDKIAKNNLSRTTLRLDRIVQEGFRSFPSKFLRLSENDADKSNGSYNNRHSGSSGDLERYRTPRNTRTSVNAHRDIERNNSRISSDGSASVTSHNVQRSGDDSNILMSRNLRRSSEIGVPASCNIQKSNGSVTNHAPSTEEMSREKYSKSSNLEEPSENPSPASCNAQLSNNTNIPASNEIESSGDNARVYDNIQRSNVENNDANESQGVIITSQITKSRDPRLNRDLNKGDVDDAVQPEKAVQESKEKDAVQRKVEQDKSQPVPRVQSYFYVYEPEEDNECKALRDYMLKTGAQNLDVSDAAKLKTVGGPIRVLIRGKHKSSLHKISNLSKLKCLRNVKFALFNTVEDVVKKTRAYTAIFQYGGVLIPDDFILKRVHPAYLQALLTFMAEENAIHQKMLWVMNIRYQVYKRLSFQRPLTWRDTFVLDLIKKYLNEGYIHILGKDYVTESLPPIQRYLETAWRQQRDLMAPYRHFIMLSNLDMQRPETAWFRNRGIGLMDIRTFLSVFAGEKKTHELLLKKPCDYDRHRPPESRKKSGHHITNPTEKQQSDNAERALPISNMVSRSTNYRNDNTMKERRLEILSSIKDVKDNLMSNFGGSSVGVSSENTGEKEKHEPLEGDTSRERPPSSEIHNGSSKNDKFSSKKDIGPDQEVLHNHEEVMNGTPRKDKNFNDESSRKENIKDMRTSKDSCRTRGGSPRGKERKRMTSPMEKNVQSPRSPSRTGLMDRKERGSSKETNRKRMTSPRDRPHKRKGSHENIGSPRKRKGSSENGTYSSKESQRDSELIKDGYSEDYKSKDSNRNADRENLTSLKCVIDFNDTNRNSKRGDGNDSTSWSRTVRSVGSSYSRSDQNSSFRGRGIRGRVFRGRGIRGRGHLTRTVYYNRNRHVPERPSTRLSNNSESMV